MAQFKIPLENVPQKFLISIGGIEYNLTCRYNDAEEAGWVFDITDGVNDLPIVSNIPLITGTDLLNGLDYLGFTGQFYVFTDGNELAVPTLDNLGVESNVYFVTED